MIREKPTLHLTGLFHTVTSTAKHSSCAFTGKVLRFPKMMHLYGYKVIEYSNGDSESEADEKVQILTEGQLHHHRAAWLEACRRVTQNEKIKGDQLHFARCAIAEKLTTSADKLNEDFTFEGDTAVIGSPHHTRFESKLKEELAKRVKPGDIILHPFGRAHASIVPKNADGGPNFSQNFHVESGIGYSDRPFGCFRVFESYAWMHYHQGMDHRGGTDYECVIPNYFDLDDWDVQDKPGEYVLFFGRMTQVKGMDIVTEIAKHVPVVAVGQGWKDFKIKGIEFRPPVSGRERSALLGGAKIVLCPTRFVEPFNGVSAEAMLCGTPIACSDFGAFSETVEHGQTGFRCHTLGDYLGAIKHAPKLNRRYIAKRARSLYSLRACGDRYDRFFGQLSGLLALEGRPLRDWYSKDPIWTSAKECH